MIYGTPQVHIVRDSTDLIGIRTLLMRQYWQATTSNPSVSELDALKPAAPRAPGGVLLMGEQTMKERGRFFTLWTYQGVNGDGKSVTFKERHNSIDYGFESGFAQVPIQQHKDFEAMKERFQGWVGNDGTSVLWEPILNATEGGSALSKKKASAGGTNPVYGVQDFFRMEGTYRFRYAARDLPPNLQSGVGYIANDLPGKAPKLEDGENWLKAPVVWQRKGIVFDITEFYWKSGREGWPEPVYRKGYFK